MQPLPCQVDSGPCRSGQSCQQCVREMSTRRHVWALTWGHVHTVQRATCSSLHCDNAVKVSQSYRMDQEGLACDINDRARSGACYQSRHWRRGGCRRRCLWEAASSRPGQACRSSSGRVCSPAGSVSRTEHLQPRGSSLIALRGARADGKHCAHLDPTAARQTRGGQRSPRPEARRLHRWRSG